VQLFSENRVVPCEETGERMDRQTVSQSDGRMDGRTDRGADGRTKVPDRLIVTFRNFANTPKTKTCV